MVGAAFPGQYRQAILTHDKDTRPEAALAHRGEEAWAGGVMGQNEIQMDGQRWDAAIETTDNHFT